jgi:5-oxoprolinase (ATP-hydrolysing)
MTTGNWQFFIDVGGTFTDVIARRPDGILLTHKLLSSGRVRGAVEEVVSGVVESGPDPASNGQRGIDNRRCGDPVNFWIGYTFEVIEPSAGRIASSRVSRFDGDRGEITLEAPIESLNPGTAYELYSDEDAPLLAIRYLMGLGLNDPIGSIDVRLGTTRATNALLERKGAKVAFVTTKGFADILKIGNQDRPSLFDLNIRKRDELPSYVIEVDERITASGTVLKAPDEPAVRRQLEQARKRGVEALAICLLHSHVNPNHEELVATVAGAVGFDHLSVSSRVCRMERIVPRGDTTVVDAYLDEAVRAYVASIRRSLPQARIQLMTSAGGLVDSAGASGKDTILSGPAGGVVGCAHVASGGGFARAIGFDMGGTSTDVSRIDPPPQRFEYQYETVKAGVRIMAPMLAVETVAAGGGSICRFDGQKLTVGPHSAGADPGPACYGRRGPLTVTDMNVFLGRVVPEYFPFKLDRARVEELLTSLWEQVNGATGSSLDRIELAEGFVRIANANMAAAIKRISVAKGYDLREYALVSFGGAGGQHACAIARMLGMSRVLLSPFAGVLSALGIGVSEAKRIGQRSVRCLLDGRARPKLEPIFEAIAGELTRTLRKEGVNPANLRPAVRTMDLCYAGQATVIPVPADPFGGAQTHFEKLHRQLYGYCHDGRAIEARAVRVELCASTDVRIPETKEEDRSENGGGSERRNREPRALVRAGPVRDAGEEKKRGQTNETARQGPGTTQMVVDGRRRSVPVYLRAQLSAGGQFAGPAVVIEATSTVVVEPGWEAEINEAGDIVLTDIQAPSVHETVSREADPIRLELFNNQFAAIAEQMGTTLRRTALSTNVKERLDFSCAIFTPAGDLVVNAPHIPVHLGAMSDCVKALIEDVGSFTPGNVYVTNDPYRGGSHLNDVTVITPVHGYPRASARANAVGEECTVPELLFFVASRAHHAEIGGGRPGSMPPDSTSLAQEGVVLRAFAWIRDGQPQHEELRALLTAPPYPSRSPEENLADVAAQVAANQTGVRELKAMIARYGVDVVHGYMQHIQTAAERKMRQALSRLADGVHRFEDRLDDGSTIRLAVTIEGDRATFDFSGTDGVHRGNLNANRAIVTSAILYCLRCLIEEDIPLNAGVLAPVEIILPSCFLNPPGGSDPSGCPAVAGGNVETSQRVVDCVFGALGTVAASQGTMNNVLLGNEALSYYETICGGAGAGPGFDGADAVHTHMTNTRLTDPEVLEARYPVRLIRSAIHRGSGGKGRYRGGCGVIRELEFLAPLELSILSQRRTTAPYGLCGGEHGQPGRNLIVRRGSAEIVELGSIVQLKVEPGDRLRIETPGGGGYDRKE